MNLDKITYLGYVLTEDGERPKSANAGYFFTDEEGAMTWASGASETPPVGFIRVLRTVKVTAYGTLDVGDEMIAEPVPATHHLVPFPPRPQAAEPDPVEEEAESDNDKVTRRAIEISDMLKYGNIAEAVSTLDALGVVDMAMRNLVEAKLTYSERHVLTEHQDKNRVGLERVTTTATPHEIAKSIEDAARFHNAGGGR